MKKAIILVLVYFLMQLLAGVVSMGGVLAYQFIKTGSYVTTDIRSEAVVPTLVLGIVFMSIILWKGGYLRPFNEVWNVLTPSYLGWTTLLGFALIFLIDSLLSMFDFLPDIMEETFDVLESGWLGIFAVSVLGPILEEMLFRGAITRELLKHYKPQHAILFSGLIFGLFHINPAQILPAMLIGFVLAWLYWRTKSIIPGIIIHIINNSLSCYLSVAHPETESIFDLMGGTAPVAFGILIALAVVYISVVKLNAVEKINSEDSLLS